MTRPPTDHTSPDEHVDGPRSGPLDLAVLTTLAR
ncbi:MAG: hypothetical protein JWR63_1720 [Conexibacter sp.]|nr:hypothetical protein [Conexibacter sp.]